MTATLAATPLAPRAGRARRTPGQLWQVPAFLLGVCCALLSLAYFSLRISPERCEFELNLRTLRQVLSDDADLEALAPVAEGVMLRREEFRDRRTDVDLLCGLVYARLAERADAESRENWEKAVRLLDQALAAGVAERELPAVEVHLARGLIYLDRELPRAIELLLRASPARGDRLQIHQLLVDTYLKLPTPDLDGALVAAQNVVEGTSGLEVDALARARLQLAKILQRKEQASEALRELEKIPSGAPEVWLQSKLLQIAICEEEGLWAQAGRVWKELLPEAGRVAGGRPRVLFSLGRCYARLSPPDFAEAAAAWQWAASLDGAEAQAAGLLLGNLRLVQPPPDYALALADWKRALEPVKASKDYLNTLVPLTQVRAFFQAAIRRLLDEQEYALAADFAELFGKVAEPGKAEWLRGEAAEAQAQALQRKLDARLEQINAVELQMAYRRAGQAFRQAARACANQDKNCVEALWRGARCFLAARELDAAAELLEAFVKLDQGEARLAEAWYSLGEAYRGQQKLEPAIQAYFKTIEFPNTPFAYRARYHLALLELDRGNLEQAQAILEQNLDPRGQSLDRDAHENSLYKLAGVLVRLQHYDRAVIRLKEAIQQYPGHEKIIVFREQLGECYRRLAEQAHSKEAEVAGQVVATEDNRTRIDEWTRHYRRARIDWLEKSTRTYQELVDDLTGKRRVGVQAMVLRRAQFNLAENALDRGDLDEALKGFEQIVQSHRGSVEAMISGQRLVSLLPMMDQSPEQRSRVRSATENALRAIQEDLAQLPEDSPHFQGAGVWSKRDWTRWLVHVRSQLRSASGPTELPPP